MTNKSKVFVSYSWDSIEHREFVKREICERLKNDGIDVICDCYLRPGDKINRFMTSGISEADKVIIVCTERYSKKVESGSGGVAFEESIISSELTESQTSGKFIPVFVDNANMVLPPFLSNLYGVNFNTDASIEKEYPKLLEAISEGIESVFTKNTSQVKKNIGIISLGEKSNVENIPKENVLDLSDSFSERQLLKNLKWNEDIADKVEGFLKSRTKQTEEFLLTLYAHASIAFVAGKIIQPRYNVKIDQSGRRGKATWYSNDGSSKDAPDMIFDYEQIGQGSHIAVAINITRFVTNDVKHFIANNEIQFGTLLQCDLPPVPGQSGVLGGEHASILSDQITAKIKELQKSTNDVAHIFFSAPNVFAFYLGQQAIALNKYQMYEFDYGNTYTYFQSVNSGNLEEQSG